MSCPKCETGLLVNEVVTIDGGLQFEQWRCINCSKRLTEEEYMGWTAAQRAKHSETMKKNHAERKKGKTVRSMPLQVAETEEIELIDHEACESVYGNGKEAESFSGLTPITEEELVAGFEHDTRSPAVIEIDKVIAEMEQDINRISLEVTALRSIRARLVQRQGC